jgi:hypothetical protein
MRLVDRNYMYVRDAAYAVGEGKPSLAAFMFTPREIQEVLGFSRNTVQKYLSMMIEDGVIRQIVVSRRITVYKFNRSYLEGITGDRLSSEGRSK